MFVRKIYKYRTFLLKFQELGRRTAVDLNGYEFPEYSVFYLKDSPGLWTLLSSFLIYFPSLMYFSLVMAWKHMALPITCILMSPVISVLALKYVITWAHLSSLLTALSSIFYFLFFKAPIISFTLCPTSWVVNTVSSLKAMNLRIILNSSLSITLQIWVVMFCRWYLLNCPYSFQLIQPPCLRTDHSIFWIFVPRPSRWYLFEPMSH